MKNNLKYFTGSFFVTIFGLLIGFGIGYIYSGTFAGGLQALFLTFILGVLEVSLSFDNAVVNATILREMSPAWRHRFITWGIAIAVFGMRIVFPLLIVSLAGWVNPWAAVVMAASEPDKYAKIMLSAHIPLAGFGGGFLMMVALRYFFDQDKTVHWFGALERFLLKMGKIQSVELAICLLIFYVLSRLMDSPETQISLLASGVFGLVTFIFVDGISEFLKIPEAGKHSIEKASAAMFLYLEILDASFSFDGVIGAFALTNNLFIIAAGLGIGAMFVRSMTIMLVEKDTLSEFIYLEHGAFYAIAALAGMMLLNVFMHVPEVVTGLVGGLIIGMAVVASILHDRKKSPARA